MQSDGSFPGQWAGSNGGRPNQSSSPIMSATSGPIQAHEFYYPTQETPAASPNDSPFAPPPLSASPMSQTPTRKQVRSASIPTNSSLSNARPTPAPVPPLPAGSVKNIADRFDQAGTIFKNAAQPQLTVRTSQDRYRRPGVSKNSAHVSPRSPTKSPMKETTRKLQKARPKSPLKSPMTSFDTNSSFSSAATLASTKSQPHMAFSPKRQQASPSAGPYMSSRPLFGEISSDGRWNGNFDLGAYPPLPTFTGPHRRSSDGSIALGHGRSQSHQDILQPATATVLSAAPYQPLSHKRSRSEMDAVQEPRLHPHGAQHEQLHTIYPTPPNSGTRNTASPTSRIPVRNRGLSNDPAAMPIVHSRSGSALSNTSPARNRISKSPTRKAVPTGKENANPSGIPRSRYHPPPLPSESNGQTLSAKIVPPPPKLSPPLRSSRPRQPVSQATTSASRARAAEQYSSSSASRDGRRPSEQWLGKPYDPQTERVKRKIPELGKINFEERRARIQKAISQNIEQSRSLESLRAKSRSRQASREKEAEPQTEPGAEDGALNAVDEQQARELDRETDTIDTMPGGWPTPGGLTVDTFQLADKVDYEPEPMTATSVLTTGTEFEFEESPILGRPVNQEDKPQLLSSATYQPPSAKSPAPAVRPATPEAAADFLPSPSVLDNVMRMRQRSSSRASRSGTDYADDSAPASGNDSPSDLGDRWGLGGGLTSVQGSIRIMLDEPWADSNRDAPAQMQAREQTGDAEQPPQYGGLSFTSNDYINSPASDGGEFVHDELHDTPRYTRQRQDTIRASALPPAENFATSSDDTGPTGDIVRMLRHYKSTGTITSEMMEHVQRHMVDLQRVSANEGSNGFMIQSLLDSVLHSQDEQRDVQMQEVRAPQPDSFDVPAVTPDTPVGWEFEDGGGTALIYTTEPSNEVSAAEGEGEEEDFQMVIRRADEEWERQRNEYVRLGTEDMEHKPAPPPKDFGYTPRSSTGPDSATLPQEFARGLRISTAGHLDLPGTQSAGDRLESEPDPAVLSTSAPQKPSYAPPIPPASASATNLPFGIPEVPPIPAAYSERGSSELSPIVRKNFWGPSDSSRPSTDSQRGAGGPPLPGSVSATSLTESTRQTSMDTTADGQTRSGQPDSQSLELKRLLKRRHIIKELLDTENTYHQDLKIIEDIYRATAVADVISLEDKKTLFGNCDEIERFSLHFYDELRKAAIPVYVPAKKGWANKRGSMSTNDSGGNGLTSDGVDEEKDRSTAIGQAFLQNLQNMEHVYSLYLKNHDAANQRLAALRTTSTVKCWLDECHNNASDITSAWDLDSLLVKPTQRVAKYPMLLQQLLETTSADHPDREALSSAAKDSVDMLTRINEAKKRADLVDQIVNRKRKESDVRSGIAKAFGRRTEKLKERVGYAEAFQDTDFDELAHKFGGHFIRLQICMRDVQDYMNRIDKSVEQINNYAYALDLFADVAVTPIPELVSKWRKYGQAVREITNVAFKEHKTAINERVIGPMVTCIKLHEAPQNAINNRKKRIVDYAKCKGIEKRGEKPDKKTVEASDLYIALNDQLKLELPKLYTLTANLVQGCLSCFLDIQLTWYNTWERKLRPVLEAADVPSSINQIEPDFRPDYDLVKGKLLELGICNGALLADSANFLSPTTTLDESASGKRPSTLDSSKRTMSIGSDAASPVPGSAAHKRRSSGYIIGAEAMPFPYDGRIRSNSSQSNRATPVQTPGSAMSGSRVWSNNVGTSSSNSRPQTANTPATQQQAPYLPPRTSADQPRSPRPMSGATYFTARPEQPEDHRFSNIFSSAMPEDNTESHRPGSPKALPDDLPVLFVCASLFEFSIDKTRKEAGYPYLTYVQGEVFDVIAQKGELWLAKNQDDQSYTLGWIWEQHFVVLSQE